MFSGQDGEAKPLVGLPPPLDGQGLPPLGAPLGSHPAQGPPGPGPGPPNMPGPMGPPSMPGPGGGPQPGSMPQMDAPQYMQQQSQIFVFATSWANKAAECVQQGQYKTIVDFHLDQPGTKQFLQVRHVVTKTNKSIVFFIYVPCPTGLLVSIFRHLKLELR